MTKKLTIFTIITFGLIWLTDFIIHQNLLMSKYMETPQLWNPQSVMEERAWVFIVSYIIVSFAYAFLYLKHDCGESSQKAAKFSLLIGLIVGGGIFSTYAYYPIDMELAISWLVACTLQFVVIGLGLHFVGRLIFKS